MHDNGFKLSYALSIAMQLGFLIAASIAGFVILGIWIDRLLHTSPIFLLFGIIASIVTIIYETYHMLVPLIKNNVEGDT